MKRILATVGLFCLVLAGCGESVERPLLNEPFPSQTTAATTLNETEPSATDVTTTATETTTTAPEEATVTMYVVDKTTLFDNGSTVYHYDEEYNIVSIEELNMENECIHTTYYEECDENGMPCKIRTVWASDDYTTYQTVSYFADGKPQEMLHDESNFSGRQYAYDQKGDVSEIRDYYDGILDTLIRYTYDGEQLSSVVCENSIGDTIYDCVVEDGRILERVYYGDSADYRYAYEYDENGNMIKETLYFAGEFESEQQFFYQAVEVNADRAPFVEQQQQLLLSIF